MTVLRLGVSTGLLAALACAPPAPPPEPDLLWSAEDVSVIVQIEDLEPMLNDPITDGRSARWKKERRPDGTLVLGYEYFSLVHGMGLSWDVEIHPDVAAARATMDAARRELARHAAVDEFAVEMAEDFYRWGDESVFAVLRHAGEPGGEIFFARLGARTVHLSLAGVYFYEGAQFHQLVDRALSNLLLYHPREPDG